jgi:hypothetical protein
MQRALISGEQGHLDADKVGHDFEVTVRHGNKHWCAGTAFETALHIQSTQCSALDDL